MVKLIIVLAAFALVGCASTSTPETAAFVAGPTASLPIDEARTICLGEVAKADLSAAPIHDANAFREGWLEAARQDRVDQVMKGCMTSRGYRAAQP